MPYRHTQRGVWIVLPCLVFAAFDAVIAWQTGQLLPVAVLILLIAVAIIFSSLTVEVSENELRWRFGPGFWTYRLPDVYKRQAQDRHRHRRHSAAGLRAWIAGATGAVLHAVEYVE